jgi:peptidoglycan L-alanyl-D-glutamate endopeptidase CwlK
MTTQADRIAAALRPLAPGAKLEQEDVTHIDALGANWERRLAVPTAAPPAAGPSGFVLGTASKAELAPVKPELRHCVELAIGLCTRDFRVNQGERSVAEQRAAVAAGNSRTMHSKHLRQADGTVWAVDLVVLTDGKVDWTFDHYAAIAFAMDRAATQLGVAGHVRWGCAWDRVLSDFGGNEGAYLAEARAYAARHAGSDLLDAPHFEWVP